MLDKLGLEKHRLFFYIVPIFLIKFMFVRYFLFERIHIIETIWVEIFYLLFIFALIEFISNDDLKLLKFIYFTNDMLICKIINFRAN
mgnify:CR=1 FL=1